MTVGSKRPGWYQAGLDHIWLPYAQMKTARSPLPVVRTDGCRIVLADGRELIDGIASWWTACHGYNHPHIRQAVERQLAAMPHVMFGGLAHEPALTLAQRLAALLPADLDRIFFSDSGSVAVEVAMKMAVQHWHSRGEPGRHRMLTVRGGYHGDTLGAMSVCDPDTGMHGMFAGVVPQQLFAPPPSPCFGEPFDDAHVTELARLAQDHREEVAAVILEPVVQGAGGMRFYAPEYLAAVRRICDETGALLITDEIATGFGRTGALFAAELAGVVPDIMCVGKAMTGGYLTMGAVLCTTVVADAVSDAESGALMHGPTYMGNPLAAATALASIRLLLDGDWQHDVARVGARLRDGLAPARDLHGVADVRTLGAIGVIETDAALPIDQLTAVAVEHGVWLRPFGRLVYAMPPYVATDDDVDRIAGAMVDAVGAVAPVRR